MKPATIKQIHAVLSVSLKNALRWEMVSKNVASQVTVPKPGEPEIAPLTEEQARVLLEVAKGHRLEGMILLAITTGLRRGEIFALKWNDIDLVAHKLTVKHTVAHITSMGYVEKEPKTRSSKRTIHLPEAVIQTLKQHYNEQVADAEKMGGSFGEWNPKGLVFLSRRRSYMHDQQTLREFHRIVAKAGLPTNALSRFTAQRGNDPSRKRSTP